MTAVQQYWIVENDALLVSTLYPISTTDEDRLSDRPLTVLFFGVEDAEYPGVVGTIEGLSFVIETFVSQWDNGFDPDERVFGDVAPLTFVIATVGAPSYDNLFDTADRVVGDITPLTLVVTTVVVQYDNLFDTADRGIGNVCTPLTFVVA